MEEMEEGDVDVDVEGAVGAAAAASSSAKGNHHHRDAFQANNGVYGASAAGYAYGHTLSSSYSSTGSVGYSPGYGAGSYGARRGSGVAMKREEDEMSVV